MKISILEKDKSRQVQNDVICKIRDLINAKNLELGDKLPSERLMSEKFGVKRNHIREAIRSLEFYGVLKSRAKSGTTLSIGRTGFNGIVNEIVSLDTPSFIDLVETRISLELKIVKLAAERRSAEDLQKIKKALDAFTVKISRGEESLEEDLLFHLAIAKASKNSTMLTLMLLITPPILLTYDSATVCEGDKIAAEIKKHEEVYLAIQSMDPEAAQARMEEHFIKLAGFIKHIQN